MLKEYVTRNNFGLKDMMFPDTDIVSHVFMRIRNRLAKRLCEPQLRKFRLYDLRMQISFLVRAWIFFTRTWHLVNNKTIHSTKPSFHLLSFYSSKGPRQHWAWF